MLKLYKKTINISAFVAAAGLLLSILCEAFQFTHSAFVQNVFVGISCSLIVVIITTTFQYRTEHTTVLNNYSSALRELLFYLKILNSNSDNPPNQEQYEYFYSELDKSFHVVCEYNNNLCWFSIKKSKLQKEVFTHIVPMRASFMKESIHSHQKSVDVLIGHKDYPELIDACINLLPDGFEKEFIMEFVVEKDEQKEEISVPDHT